MDDEKYSIKITLKSFFISNPHFLQLVLRSIRNELIIALHRFVKLKSHNLSETINLFSKFT